MSHENTRFNFQINIYSKLIGKIERFQQKKK